MAVAKYYDQASSSWLPVSYGGNSTIPLDTVHYVGGSGESAVFLNSWVNYDNSAAFPGTSTQRSARFRKFPDGRVRLAGVIKNGASGAAAFTLPVGYRPVGNGPLNIAALAGGTAGVGFIGIDPATGNVTPANYASGTNVTSYVMLDGIEFDTESMSSIPSGPAGPGGAPPVVTSLPVAPTDGQRILYKFTPSGVSVDSRLTLWHLYYNDADHSWYPIGEQTPIFAYYGPLASTAFAANSWGHVDSNDPFITVPRAGDYRVEWGANSSENSSAGINYWIGLFVNGVAPGIATGGTISGAPNSSSWGATSRGTWKQVGMPVNGTFQMAEYAQTTACTLYLIGRFMYVYPHRITG